jgi:hypothetical protein
MSEQIACAEAVGAAGRQRDDEHADGPHIGGDEQPEQRDTRVAHPAGTQLGQRGGEEQRHQYEGRRCEEQPRPPRKVDDAPALRLVPHREADEQRDVHQQDDHRLCPRLAQNPAVARLQRAVAHMSDVAAGGAWTMAAWSVAASASDSR